MDTSKSSALEISYTDTLRFRRIVMEVMSEAASLDDTAYEGIGTLGEKQMHAAIKRFICPDEACHEIRLDTREAYIDEDGKRVKPRRFVADVLVDKSVYEIQTGGLAPLAPKIRWIMENTDYFVTVIHPVAETKWVNLIEEGGEITRRYKSPDRGSIYDVAPELYFIRDLMANPRFSLVVLMLEGEQYKKVIGRDKRGRARYKKYELIPVSLLRAHVMHGVDSYRVLVPCELEARFTVKDYSKATKLRGRDAYSAVHSLCDVGLLREDGVIGRARAYLKNF